MRGQSSQVSSVPERLRAVARWPCSQGNRPTIETRAASGLLFPTGPSTIRDRAPSASQKMGLLFLRQHPPQVYATELMNCEQGASLAIGKPDQRRSV